MTMTQTTSFTGTADERLVTVADLRYELERERQITLAHFARIDQRFLDLTTSVDARFEQVNERFHELATSIDARFEQVDKRFEQVDKRFEQVDKRFEQVDKRFDRIDARFDALDERLRSNKTLVILSISTAASIASVVISLLK
jgi:predicted nuclease with TOPRIM domain